MSEIPQSTPASLQRPRWRVPRPSRWRASASDPATGSRRWKKLGCGCASFLFALVVGVIALEWYLRRHAAHFLGPPAAAHGMFESSADGRYRLKPGWVGTQTIDGRTTGIAINSRGLRQAELVAKQPGEIRIAVLGDSFVFGQGVAEEETIPARLQELLRARLAPAVTVLNCGVTGHGTQDLPLSLARCMDLQPDLVVACTYLGNDFTDDCRRHAAVAEGYILFGPLARASRTSMRFRLTLRYRTMYLFEQFLARFIPAAAFDRSQLQKSEEEDEALRFFPPRERHFAGLFFDRRAEDALVEEILGRCRANYGALGRTAAGIPIVHVILPTWWHLSDEDWRAALEKIGFDPADYEIGTSQRRLLKLAATMGIGMVDLTPNLRDAADREALWLPTDRHFSAAGCQRVAEWLLPSVRAGLGR